MMGRSLKLKEVYTYFFSNHKYFYIYKELIKNICNKFMASTKAEINEYLLLVKCYVAF